MVTQNYICNCGKCTHFHMDDIYHNIGHCDVNRMERFTEEDLNCGMFTMGKDKFPKRINKEA